jgi:Holliday junction DNA helicase RuvB
MLTAPLRDRFGIINRLEYYTREELTEIVMRSAEVLGVAIEPAAAGEIAGRSRGTPRLANRLLKRVRDFAQIKYGNEITCDAAQKALDFLEVDNFGLDNTDRAILKCMTVNFGGRPVGIEAIATTIGEDPGTLEEVYEPFLVQNGFILRTPRGRVPSREAYKHLGLSMPEE